MRALLSPAPLGHPSQDVACLFLRVATAVLLFFGHGIGKVALLRGDASAFPDPLGLGPALSVVSSLATECGGSALVAIGVGTRLACVPVLFTMGVVALVVHKDHSWLATEPSVLFFLLFSLIAYLGPGRFSVDGLIARGARTR